MAPGASAALALAGIAVGILRAPHWLAFVLLGLALPAESPPTPAVPPRRGLTSQTENSTTTQWEDGTRDVTVVPIPEPLQRDRELLDSVGLERRTGHAELQEPARRDSEFAVDFASGSRG